MDFLFSKVAGIDGYFSENITTSYTSLIKAPSEEWNGHHNGAWLSTL